MRFLIRSFFKLPKKDSATALSQQFARLLMLGSRWLTLQKRRHASVSYTHLDVYKRQVAENAGQNAVGVILTGMGDDGARGMKEMREAGAPTIAQDERTSVVWGMPGQAVKLGGVDKVCLLYTSRCV